MCFSLSSKIQILPQRRQGRGEVIFLFGGEPFDRAHGPESIEGRPPNKKTALYQKTRFLQPYGNEKQCVSIPEG
jgi:hypothetical protein